ncbi:MAG: isochorismate synthase [Oligoflexia bacterium]|nr:isochorismate synthase [Oligoflexia bacterium]MBF0366553.1 isochorismate synthase [Oligoflexia bacterium]
MLTFIENLSLHPPMVCWKNRGDSLFCIGGGNSGWLSEEQPKSQLASDLCHLRKLSPYLKIFGGVDFFYFTSKSSKHCFFIPFILLEEDKRKKRVMTITISLVERSGCGQDFLETKMRERFFLLPEGIKGDRDVRHGAQLIEEMLVPSEIQWKKQVSVIKEQLDYNNKVVLSRNKVFYFDSFLYSRQVLRNIFASKEYAYIFYLEFAPKSAFLSISPERLFLLHGDEIETEALAGTLPREKGNARQLSQSAKDIREHDIVCKDIESKLQSICGHNWETVFHQKVMRLKKLFHLYSKFRGVLHTSVDKSILHLIEHFHPTPAVLGYPYDMAMEAISLIESEMHRGFYAAPVGMISSVEVEFAVGIRSALFDDNKVIVYGGAGIVEASDIDWEWYETSKKIENFSSYLFS